MKVVAVLLQVLGVGVVERQSVATRLQLSRAVVALPVLVARHRVWVEAVVVGTFEVLLLCARCKHNTSR